MTKAMQQKLKDIRAIARESDRGEVWIDSDGKRIPVDRVPVDWRRNAQPRDTIKTEEKGEE